MNLGQQAGTNTIMLVPASMPEAGWPPIGTFGFKELPRGQPGEKPVKKTTPTDRLNLRGSSRQQNKRLSSFYCFNHSFQQQRCGVLAWPASHTAVRTRKSHAFTILFFSKPIPFLYCIQWLNYLLSL